MKTVLVHRFWAGRHTVIQYWCDRAVLNVEVGASSVPLFRLAGVFAMGLRLCCDWTVSVAALRIPRLIAVTIMMFSPVGRLSGVAYTG